MWKAFAGRGEVLLLGFLTSLVIQNVSSQSDSTLTHLPHNSLTKAVYNELIKAIDTINAQSKKVATSVSRLPLQKKLIQDDEDDAGEFIEGLPPFLPMIFQLLGSTLSLNSTAVSQNTYGLIPERVSSQITNVIGSLANRILGTPTTTKPPPRRRRRTTTTRPPDMDNELTTSDDIDMSELLSNSTHSSVQADIESEVIDARNNGTEEATTSASTSSTTEEMLFKQSSLGESPVYAAAYAPNYIHTTPYPIYASKFLHVLYPVPTTPTTTPEPTTTTPTTTTTDPNSYSVSLPFDYQEITTGKVVPSNFSGVAVTEEDDYDYDEFTEESRIKVRRNKVKVEEVKLA